MEIKLSAVGEDQVRDLRSLHAWLVDDRELRTHGVQVHATGKARPGEMGLSPEWIGAVCSVVSVAQLLVTSIRSWLRGRRPSSTITFHIMNPEADTEVIQQALVQMGLIPLPLTGSSESDVDDE